MHGVNASQLHGLSVLTTYSSYLDQFQHYIVCVVKKDEGYIKPYVPEVNPGDMCQIHV